jgi:hypothetical protein
MGKFPKPTSRHGNGHQAGLNAHAIATGKPVRGQAAPPAVPRYPAVLERGAIAHDRRARRSPSPDRLFGSGGAQLPQPSLSRRHLLRKIMNKPIATTANAPSTKMRGLSIGIFPGFGGRWRAPSARKKSLHAESSPISLSGMTTPEALKALATSAKA